MPKSRASRAQIFQSFDALKGFRELLKEQEKVIVPAKIMSQDDYDQLNYKIHQIQCGKIIQIIIHKNDQYIQIQGKVSKINFETKIIQIVKQKFDMLSIVDIEFLNDF